jgi:hypothetical protein
VDERAKEIINLYDREWSKNANFRSLWQDVADLSFPREANITVTNVKGTELGKKIYDTTAIVDSKIMTDGLCSAIIPAGEPFFKFNVGKNNIGGVSDEYETYLMEASEQLHIDMFASNFLLVFNEAIRSLISFGTGNVYSEWSKKAGGLNYKEYDISLYIPLENSGGTIDTCIIKFQYTPRQAYQEWGKDNVGKSVVEAYNDEKKRHEPMSFIHIVRPREKRRSWLEGYLDMPFESIYVAIKDKHTIEEGGFPEFPYHIARWTKTTGEIMGRGIGTEIIRQLRYLNKLKVDFVECADKNVNPPREQLESFDGELKVFPGAVNIVQEIPSTRAMESLTGNFPISEKTLESEREEVHKAYYRDVFVQLADLKGDRRTTVEIRQRILEGLRRVGQPVHRIYSELMESLIIRSLRLEIRNGRIPPPPPGLDTFEIEYLGLMANALSSGQARGFQQWAVIGSELEKEFPGIKDNINTDEGFRDLGRSLGVKAEHMNTEEEREAIRQERARQLEQRQALEMAQAAAQGYSQTTGAPEEGSVAGELMEALK